MKKNGIGGALTQSGKVLENKIYKYLKENDIIKENMIFLAQEEFTNYIKDYLNFSNVQAAYESIGLGQYHKPDLAIIYNNCLYIGEFKLQNSDGSVDMKIGNWNYFLQHYQIIAENIFNINKVKMFYILEGKAFEAKKFHKDKTLFTLTNHAINNGIDIFFNISTFPKNYFIKGDDVLNVE